MEKSVNRRSSRVLIEAVRKKSSKEVDDLLVRGSNANSLDCDGNSALHHAVRSRNKNVVELLLKHGATVDVIDSDGLMPFNIADECKDFSCLEILLKHRTSVSVGVFKNSLGVYPKKILDLLCDCVDINGMDQTGYTALHLAVNCNNLYAVQKLLLRGADVNIITAVEEYAPLHLATSSECVNILLQNGAELDLKDKFDRTPLNTIVLGRNFTFEKYQIERNEEARMIEMLFSNGADGVNVVHAGQISLDYGKSLETIKGLRDVLRYMALKEEECKYLAKTGLRLNDKTCELGRFYTTCLNEVNKLKEETVFDKITFYDFITKNLKQLSEKIVDLKVSKLFRKNKPKYDIQFPVYFEVVQRHLDDALERHTLRESASMSISIAVPCVDSQHIVTQQILELLEFDDMKNLIAACKSMLCIKDI